MDRWYLPTNAAVVTLNTVVNMPIVTPIKQVQSIVNVKDFTNKSPIVDNMPIQEAIIGTVSVDIQGNRVNNPGDNLPIKLNMLNSTRANEASAAVNPLSINISTKNIM